MLKTMSKLSSNVPRKILQPSKQLQQAKEMQKEKNAKKIQLQPSKH